MKKVGLYFGSFNPVTTGHMIVAQEALAHVDEIWFILSPQNPQKDPKDLLGENDRYALLLQALSDANNPKFKLSDVELKLSKPSYTCDTLSFLKSIHSDCVFHVITGTDAYQNVPTWKKGINIMQETPFIIVKRGDKNDFNLK